jgi:hypothetical protein
MVQDTDLSRFVSSLLPSALQGGYSHRALLAFNIGAMHEYIVRCKILDEGIVGFVVSALVEALKGGSDGNVVVRVLKFIASSNKFINNIRSLEATFCFRLFLRNAIWHPELQRLSLGQWSNLRLMFPLGILSKLP